MDVRNIRLKIAYDGTDFSGWQTQPGLPTIQDSIESALGKMIGQRPKLIGSGRTDAGVHAHGQIASFYTTAKYHPSKFQNAVNAYLPDTIRILNAEDVSVAFHPTLDAISKRYQYRVVSTYQAVSGAGQKGMSEAAVYLVGRHDFAAFQTVGSERVSTVRRIYGCDVRRVGTEIQIEVESNGFLYNMVRTIAGTLIMVGTGKWEVDRVRDIVASCDRKKAGPTAPAKGLAMMWVNYEQPREIK